MPSGREELRRGVRHLIETASREMDALAEPPAPPVLETRAPAAAAPEGRPILQLVRPVPTPVQPPARPGPAAVATMVVGTTAVAEATSAHTRKGVCAAYYLNRKCWEVSDAYCNQALHVCMLRECPVYHLNREELEERFARKFAHLW